VTIEVAGVDAAIETAALGLRVLPIVHPRHGGESPGKRPDGELVPHGLHDATTNVKTIVGWWEQRPDSNIGVALGKGLIVLDVDRLDALRSLGPVLAWTRMVRTGRGAHLYYKAPAWVTNSAGRLPAGVHVRGLGGYVVAPPSVHPSGRTYRWLNPDEPIAQAPDGLLDLLRPLPAPAPAPTPTVVRAPGDADAGAQAALQRAVERMARAQRDSRHDTLRNAAYRLGGFEHRGLALADVIAALTPVAVARMGDERAREIDRTIRQCHAAGTDKPVISHPPARAKRRRSRLDQRLAARRKEWGL